MDAGEVIFFILCFYEISTSLQCAALWMGNNAHEWIAIWGIKTESNPYAVFR